MSSASKSHTISDSIAKPFLLPGTLVCNAVGIHGNNPSDYSDLVRMLVNSLIWTVAGVIVMAFFA
ncbi:hypothetical protein [Nitrobacter hamburgensis]|uniref:hypothetical protein n=1 Tax=Nitrobacter hamburgensis TaxID=912 RepID=UPI00059BC0A9|nr:hypothetical protein [Nitrobacter hamburgensis]